MTALILGFKCPSAKTLFTLEHHSLTVGAEALNVNMSFKPLPTAPVVPEAVTTPWDPAVLAELVKLLGDSSPAVRMDVCRLLLLVSI
jgi:hypothetical protein